MALTIVSVMAFAVDTKLRIDIVGDVEPSASKDYVYLIQADRYSAAKDSSDILKMMNGEKKVSVWAITPLGNLSTMQTDKLKGTFIGFHANANTGYTMSFPEDWLSGEIMTIIDHANSDSVIVARKGSTYHFTVSTTKQDYTTRFEIGDPYLVPTEFKVCHQYGKIIVDNNTDEAMDVLVDDTKIGSAPAKTFAAEVPLTGISAGQHYLKVNGQLMIILVQ